MAADAATSRAPPSGRSRAGSAGAGGPEAVATVAGDPRSLLPRLLVFGLLVAAAALETGPAHEPAHWLVLAVYGAGSLALAAWRGGRSREVAWAALGLDAALATYVLAENASLRSDDLSRVPDMLGQLPALLLLLQTALTLSIARTLAFSGLVAAGWAAIVVHAAWAALPAAVVQQKLFGLVAFLAACLFVVHGVRRLRLALASATRSELERAALARFVPAGKHVDLVRRGARSGIQARSATLMTVDIRGFSELTRRHGAPRVVEWLLDFRALVHAEVAAAGGIVDKYAGDGVLALFLDGSAERQAEAALRCALATRTAVAARNADAPADTPALRVTAALHSGEVLAGVFDDGLRAEFSVLGPAMNAMSRIERRAKGDGLDLVCSKRVAGLVDAAALGLAPRRLGRLAGDDDCPDIVALMADGRSPAGSRPRALGIDAA